jgi:hypothetical protein
MLAIEERAQLQLARETAIRRQEAELEILGDAISKTRQAFPQRQASEPGEL